MISAHDPRVKAECSTVVLVRYPILVSCIPLQNHDFFLDPFQSDAAGADRTPASKSPSQPRCIQTMGLMSNVLRHFRQQCVNCSSQRASAILPVSHPSGPSILAVPLSSGAAGGGKVEGINLSASILTSLQGFFFSPFFQLNGHHPRSNPRGARGVDFLSVCLE